MHSSTCFIQRLGESCTFLHNIYNTNTSDVFVFIQDLYRQVSGERCTFLINKELITFDEQWEPFINMLVESLYSHIFVYSWIFFSCFLCYNQEKLIPKKAKMVFLCLFKVSVLLFLACFMYYYLNLH